eukprot:CAMPEP_0119330102 /NCGR_PEP_ID=MMETSP1333-20130426/77503_1 /TAXON_ID=418940 /ORGANISM="Scyphosphaera apsteinii, Strain RCC1455" /LENGTH=308 /DNA_ID=CAMNT_0007339407 /DNA_START=31 /DNA_END=957 /DNA_ORIENTATION=+
MSTSVAPIMFFYQPNQAGEGQSAIEGAPVAQGSQGIPMMMTMMPHGFVPTANNPAAAAAAAAAATAAAAAASAAAMTGADTETLPRVAHEPHARTETLTTGGLSSRGPMKNKPLEKRWWQPDEDQLLSEAVARHGETHWQLVSQLVPGRNGKQCRERWLNHLRPGLKVAGLSDWTPEEDSLINELVGAIGTKWSEIAKQLPGRTDNAIKNRYYSEVRKEVRQQRRAEMSGEKAKNRPASRKRRVSSNEYEDEDEDEERPPNCFCKLPAKRRNGVWVCAMLKEESYCIYGREESKRARLALEAQAAAGR